MSETADRIKLEDSWKSALLDEFDSGYMRRLRKLLQGELEQGKRIYPRMSKIFLALDLCPLDKVRVVILGQDPYHGPNQAHGLCFSVEEGIQNPPSLVNILKEVSSDVGTGSESTGSLSVQGSLVPWAEQGVLLLNSVLTVEAGKAMSHHGFGWERFTDRVIELVNEVCENVVFLLWGSPARKKASIVDRQRHLVLEAPHPSPLSAHRGFFGCKHFSSANRYLTSKGYKPIDWLAVV